LSQKYEEKDVDTEKQKQMLYYIFFYFLCFKEYATEVCIDDIINNNNVSKLDILNNYYKNKFTDGLDTSGDVIYTHYNEIFKQILLIQIGINNKKKIINNNFNKFVKTINDKLKNIKSDTIQYKLNNSFKLEYYDIGLFNNLQYSGSCTFYSYYNLAINMKILSEYIKWKTNTFNNIDTYVKNFIEAFVKCHYYNVFLYCVSNDISIIQNYYYDDRSIYNQLYIYREIEEKDLYIEFIELYDNENLLFNKKTTIPCKILKNIKYYDTFEKKISLENIKNTYTDENFIFFDIYTYLKEQLVIVRTGKNFDMKDFKDKLTELFSEPKKNLLKKIHDHFYFQ